MNDVDDEITKNMWDKFYATSSDIVAEIDYRIEDDENMSGFLEEYKAYKAEKKKERKKINKMYRPKVSGGGLGIVNKAAL